MEELLDSYKRYLSYNIVDIKDNVPKFMGSLSYFIEQIIDTDAETLKTFLIEESKKDIFVPASWIRLIIIQRILLQNINDKQFFEWAIGNLSLFYDSENVVILELEKKINQL